MKMYYGKALAVALGGLLLHVLPAAAAPPIPGTWQLQFEDNFDGPALDGAKWKLGEHVPGLAGVAGMAPENITVSGGNLNIKAEQRSVTYSGVTKAYASGEISTFFQYRQQYGYFEARIKTPAVKGLWPAFWLMPDRGTYGWQDVYSRTYVKFDLTGVSPGAISTAELRMKVSAVESGGNNNVLFMKLHNDAWHESTLTWNNKPAPDPAWIAQRMNQATAGQDMTVDVKDYIVQEMAGDKVVSFVLADTFMLTKYVKFFSRETPNAADRPRLVINGVTYYASEDATVKWGTLANNNYGTATELAVEDDWGDTASTYNGGMEVDMMETLGIWGPNVTSHAAHWDGYGASHQAIGSGLVDFPASPDGYHIYGLYWKAGKLEYYVDGIKTFEWANARVMSVPAYLILSFQVGGWDGNTAGPQVNNQVMDVDWVRVWSGTESSPSTVIADNANTASVSSEGAWTVTNGLGGFYGANYAHDGNTDKGSKAFHFEPALTGNGDYLAYARWSASANRASNAPMEITDSFGTTWPVTVNQKLNGGVWNLLGGYSLAAANADISIFNEGTDGFVIADAVEVVPAASDAFAITVDNTDAAHTSLTGTWAASNSTAGYLGSNYVNDGNTGKGLNTFSFLPSIPAVGDYLVYGRWTSFSNRANNVPIDIVRADGQVETVTVDQTRDGGSWILLGAWTLSPTNARITIRTDGTNGFVVADAIKLLPPESAVPSTVTVDNADASGVTLTGAWVASTSYGGFWATNFLHDDNAAKGTKSVRFTPTLPAAGNYQVFARWVAATNRASNAPIDVIGSSGTQTVTVDQRANGAAWVSLGTFAFNAGTAGSVLIRTTGTDGYVIADAVKFVRVP